MAAQQQVSFLPTSTKGLKAGGHSRRRVYISEVAQPPGSFFRLGLHRAADSVENRLRVPVHRVHALVHHLNGGRVRQTAVQNRGHRLVLLIRGILLVHNSSHPGEGVVHLLLLDNAMVQPVRQVLGVNPQSGTVFHQTNVVDVGHLGAADALVDPTHNVPQDGLTVVVQLLAKLVRGQGTLASQREQRWGENVLQLCPRELARDLLEAPRDIHPVVVHGVQAGGSGAGHPCAVGTCFRVPDLLVQHRTHGVGHRPHPLADLRHTRKTAGNPNVHVPVLVCIVPLLRLDRVLAGHWPQVHGGVNLITGAVHEAGVDEAHTVNGRADTLLQVSRGPALLVHDSDFHRAARQPQNFLHGLE
eukprot:RCo044812